MRALVVTNMYPSADDPGRGSFVRDQVKALRELPGLEVELYGFRSAGSASYARAGRDLRRRYAGQRFDVVHAHFGLTIWPALAVRGTAHGVTLHGTDLVHPRSRAIALAGLPFMDLVAPVSEELAARVPGWTVRGEMAILPAGVDTERFHPIEREEARRRLGLAPDRSCLLFSADPGRAEKRYDRARAVAGGVPLLTLGRVDPLEVPLWVNAANAVLVTSERESFGLAVLEALACDVPVLSTPVGIAPQVLDGVQGVHCGPFDEVAWRELLEPLLAAQNPRIQGRQAAEAYSSRRMAERMADAWRSLI